jgi:hypothetical protein
MLQSEASCSPAWQTSKYKYPLATLMLIDEFNHGIPVAHAIIETETVDSLTKFLRTVKATVAFPKDVVFIIDKSTIEQSALASVFEGATILLCHFHVMQAMRRYASVFACACPIWPI